MRFLGNKDSIKHEILDLLKSKNLIDRGLKFFDAFCGSGAVADSVKNHFDIVINDILTWCVTYTTGRIFASNCDFTKLGFNPFDYLNNNNDVRQGFIFNNYSPGGSNRMYFTAENASRIDFFRFQIEEWKNVNLINEIEYSYLLACLIDSVSHVSNTAGVYGAFLKEWDSRAIKPIQFLKIDASDAFYGEFKTFNKKIEEIVIDVDCDVLYIDPPYTQNQYGTQYHLLETLILNDTPSVSKITGSRPVTPMRSEWSKEYKANILFDKIITQTKAKHIFFSYNSDGFMSKDFIEACLKRYGLIDTFVCKKISYKKYQNWKTKIKNEHFEFLFYIEKKPADEVVYECPLNYVGSKAKMITEIKKYMPAQFTKVVDVFGGGFNVGVNLPAKKTTYNDLNHFVTQLIKSFQDFDIYEYLLYIRKITKKYGLGIGNGEAYREARAAFNALPIEKRDPRFLFTLILYGFQQQIRFNSDHEFNNPAGNRWCNDKVLEKMISFSRRIKECNCIFYSRDFKELVKIIDSDTFVYLDPPYRLTCGAYNDGKRGFEGWTIKHETELFIFLDELDSKGIPFMFSYVLENGGLTNGHVHDWLNKRGNYSIIEIATGQGRYGVRKEVLIVNG
jgi:adenine-specific DNA-methyltransferase